MSVEDIDYLMEHSEVQNFIVYCDSGIRNRIYHPTPAEYTITFQEPFKNVVGCDILDGSIPATSYNVETYANSMSGFTYSLNALSTSEGYSLQSLMTEMEAFPEFEASMLSTTPVGSASGSSASRITGQVVIASFEQAHVLYKSTDPDYENDPAYDNIPLSGPSSVFWLYRRGFMPNISIFPNRFASIGADPSIPIYEFTNGDALYTIRNDPSDTVIQNLIFTLENYRCLVVANDDGTYDLIYYDIQQVQQSCVLNLINYSQAVLYQLSISFWYTSAVPGNYSAISFLEEAKHALGGTNVTVAASSSNDVSIQPKLKFSGAGGFVLNMEKTSLRQTLGFDEYGVDNSPDYTKIKFKQNKQLFGAIYTPSSETWNLTAPGVIYLLGTRYCILRCPEVESHIYASRAFGQFAPGIGMFKMYAVNDIAHQRFDYVNFHRRPIHPIGRLDKMTFRFEKIDGSLYDFKGANHLLLICIRYLVPTQKKKMTRSILNPNYTPDFNAYLVRHMAFKEPEDDGHGQKTEYNRRELLKREIEYDYSSSGDDEDGDAHTATSSEVEYDRVVPNALANMKLS